MVSTPYDRLLTYASSNVSDVDSITLAHLLYGRQIMSLPYSYNEDPEDHDQRLCCQMHR